MCFHLQALTGLTAAQYDVGKSRDIRRAGNLGKARAECEQRRRLGTRLKDRPRDPCRIHVRSCKNSQVQKEHSPNLFKE